MYYQSISGWNGWLRINTTDTCSIRNSEFDVSINSPIRSPWVLNKEIFNSIFNTITNSKDSMIELSTTSRACNNTTSVQLENWGVSFNSYWNWTFVQCSFKLWRCIWCNILVGLNWNNTFRFVIFASKNTSWWCVWIVSFSLKWMRFCIIKCKIHKTTIASMI